MIRDDLEREELQIEKENALERSLREWEMDHPALREVDRCQEAAEKISEIESLKPQLWREMDEAGRRWTLEEVGRKLSRIYRCPKPPLLTENGEGKEMGSYEEENWMIKADKEILLSDDPRKALKTYLHEFRHSYQIEQIRAYEKGLAVDDQQKAQLWAENIKNYVESPQEDYESQPLERDANRFADQIAERVFRKIEER